MAFNYLGRSSTFCDAQMKCPIYTVLSVQYCEANANCSILINHYAVEVMKPPLTRYLEGSLLFTTLGQVHSNALFNKNFAIGGLKLPIAKSFSLHHG